MKPSDPFSEMNDNDRTIVRPSPGGRRSHSSVSQIRRTSVTGLPQALHDAADLESDNPLLSCAFSLFSLVPRLRNLPFHDAVNELRQRLIEEIRNFEQRAYHKGASRQEVDIAKYFLCSLLDETVLNTPWGSQSGWGHNSLSSLFYKKMAGGEEFFQIVDRLKQQPSQNQNLLGVAYICLSLGFEGRYRYTNNGLISLERQRQELYLLIQRLKGQPELELSNHWQGIRDTRNPLTRYVPLWVLAGVTGVVLMLIYMVYAFSIRNASDGLYDDLIAITQQMTAAAVPAIVQPLQVVKRPTRQGIRWGELLAPEIEQHMAALMENGGLRLFNMFSSGSADIKPGYREMLVKIARALQQANAGILIVGHTDNQRLKFSSRFKSNWHLSLARAQSTSQALARYGLAQDSVRCEGMAHNDPIAPNDTAANRARNRRVDIVIR
jgi:type VI secretion system protein ImpK